MHSRPREEYADDPELVLAEERAERERAKRLLAEQETLDLQARLAELEQLQRGKVEQEPQSSAAPIEFGGKLRIRNVKDIALILAVISGIGGLTFGVMNSAQKYPSSDAKAVETKVAAVELRVDGKTDQKGASSQGESLSERVAALELLVRPEVANRCPLQQFYAQVFDRLGAHGIQVQGCPAPKPIEAEPTQGLPGRPSQRREYLIKTPLPAP